MIHGPAGKQKRDKKVTNSFRYERRRNLSAQRNEEQRRTPRPSLRTRYNIYREGGENNNVSFSIDASSVVLDLSVNAVHDVTGCLKAFFRRLPDPLLTGSLLPAFVDAARSRFA